MTWIVGYKRGEKPPRWWLPNWLPERFRTWVLKNTSRPTAPEAGEPVAASNWSKVSLLAFATMTGGTFILTASYLPLVPSFGISIIAGLIVYIVVLARNPANAVLRTLLFAATFTILALSRPVWLAIILERYGIKIPLGVGTAEIFGYLGVLTILLVVYSLQVLTRR